MRDSAKADSLKERIKRNQAAVRWLRKVFEEEPEPGDRERFEEGKRALEEARGHKLFHDEDD
ncbi:MAG TPA: hypothetical protein VG370_18120 [Chloroflexota bacterium]|nr:hypothetical protein [Chloroflexota bacterium]